MPPRAQILLLTASLFASSGEAQLPYLVKDLNTNLEHAYGSYPRHFLSIGVRVLFLARTASTIGYEIWSTDGTEAGTRRAASFCPEGWNGTQDGGWPLLGVASGVAILSEYCVGDEWTQRLWSSDGTAAGTVLLPVDRELVYVGGELIDSYLPQTLDGKFLFTARESVEAPLELWATDGSESGTSRVATLDTDPSHLTRFIVALDDFAIVGLDSFETNTLELWRTDGSVSGTTSVGSFDVRIWSGDAMAVAGNQLFFAASGSNGEELWVSDGTASGTRPLTAFAYDSPILGMRKLRPFGNEVLFFVFELGTEYEIWRSDGTVSGTFPLSDFVQYSPIPYDAYSPEAVKLDDSYYFLGRAEDGFLSLWRNDGAPGTAYRVKDVAPPEQWFPRYMWIEAVGPHMVFTGYDGEGWEPFVSDGTAPGTFRLADTCAGACSGEPAEVLRDGASVFFSALDIDGRRQVWRTDGTIAGTRRLTSTLRETNSRFYAERFLESAPLGEGWVFRANDGQHGFEPWFADQDSARLIADLFLDLPGIQLGQSSSRVGEIAFSTRNDFDFENFHVYRSDGSAEGSFEIATAPRFGCGIVSGNGAPAIFPLSRGIVFAESDCGSYGPIRAWSRSTQEIVPLFSNDPPIRPGSVFSGSSTRRSAPRRRRQRVPHAVLDDSTAPTRERTCASSSLERYYFFQSWQVLPGIAVLPGFLEEYYAGGLFILDLTQWTHRWITFAAESEYGLHGYQAIAGRIFVETYGASGPPEIWVTDTTPAGTQRLVTLPVGHNLDSPFLELDGRAFFGVFDFNDGYATRLWISDGTPAGTRTIHEFPEAIAGRYSRAVQNRIAFAFQAYDAESEAYSSELWMTDGSAPGTQRVAELTRAGAPETVSSFFEGPSRLFFSTNNGLSETTFWSTDGSGSGTVPLWTNPPPAGLSEAYAGVLAVSDYLFFAGFDEAHGSELWLSAGTPDSTRLLADLQPGPGSSLPTDFTQAGDRLFFLADDGVHGRELWVLRETGHGSCQPSGTTLCLLGGRFSIQMTTSAGAVTARPLTDATGSFSRGADDSPDTFVKFVNGNAVNGSQWLFAADRVPDGFELEVVDTANGASRTWSSAGGELASFADIAAFETFPSPLAAPVPPAAFPSSASGDGCVESATRLCFAGGRIAVEASGVGFDGATLAARASALDLGSDQRGFWLFDPSLLELVVRVEEPSPGRFALAVASLTNLGYAIAATDLLTGDVRTVDSPAGQFRSQAVDDLFGAAP